MKTSNNKASPIFQGPNQNKCYLGFYEKKFRGFICAFYIVYSLKNIYSEYFLNIRRKKTDVDTELCIHLLKSLLSSHEESYVHSARKFAMKLCED